VDILEAIGEDPTRDGLESTPQRVARMYTELFSGMNSDPVDAIDAIFDEDHHDPVVLRNISFHSMCEHHLLPFFGVAHIGYIPNGRIAGISKLARCLEVASRRPQVQERLTSQVADAIVTALAPKGVVIEIEAEHLCVSMRGIRKSGSTVVTTASRGKFENCDMDRDSLLTHLRNR